MSRKSIVVLVVAGLLLGALPASAAPAGGDPLALAVQAKAFLGEAVQATRALLKTLLVGQKQAPAPTALNAGTRKGILIQEGCMLDPDGKCA